MLKKTIKFFRNSAILLAVVSISFSNIPFYSLTKTLDSYIASRNIVDKVWHLSQNDNVVDKFASYRNILEKVKIYEAQAAVSFVGGNVASGTNTAYNLSLTALTGGLASSPTEGDIVVVVNTIVNTTNGNPGVGTAGYTEVYDGYRSDTYDANLSTNYKIMGVTPDTVVSCNPSNSTTRASDCVALVFRGVDITTPMDVTRTIASAGNSEDVNCPAITPTTPGAWVLCTGAAAGASVDIATPTPPAGFVGRFIQTDPGSSGAAVASYMSWTGGAVDPAPYVMDLGTASQNSWVAATLALRPRNYPPELTISQPDGAGDTVMVGDLYDITYDLNDIEEPVTVAMYYDTDAVGLNGTAITGACATANEGTGVTCSWDTTGVTPGTYYVYGLTSDGYNPQVSDYSPGMITIIPPPTITDYANTDEPALDYSLACTSCGARIGGGAIWQQEVTLTGVTFGADPGVGNRSTATNNVTVGGHRIADANVTAWSDSQIIFKTDASVTGDTDADWGTEYGGAGALTVTAGGITSAGLIFNVFPQVTSLTACNKVDFPVGDGGREYDAGDSACPNGLTDGEVFLNGTRFGTAATGGYVQIFGIGATTPSWGNELIRVRVPSSASYTGSLVVQQGQGSNNKTHTYTTTNFRIFPRITGFTPPNAAEGADVTIDGNHFCQAGCPGAFDASNFVTFTNNKTATFWGGWTDTTIATKVPTNSVSGDVVIASNDYNSNPSLFTVNSLRPNAPTLMNQWRNVGLDDSIPAQGAASSTPMYLAMEVENTANSGGMLYPEIEYKPVGTPFACVTPNVACVDAVSGLGAGAAPGPHDCNIVSNNCAISITPTDDVYHWQARAHFDSGSGDYYGPWLSFGDPDENLTDFQIDSTGPVITFPNGNNCAGAVSQLGTNSVKIDWSINEQSTGQVEYGTDANLAGSTLSPVPPAAASPSHSITLSNLNSGTTYYFKVKSRDNAGNLSSRPTANPYCSFTTSSVSQPAKTTRFHIAGDVSAVTGGTPKQYQFYATTTEANIAKKSAFVILTGIYETTNVSPSNSQIDVQYDAEAVGNYILPGAPSGTHRGLFKIVRSVGTVNTASQSTLTVTPDANTTLYINSAELVMTYSYTP